VQFGEQQNVELVPHASHGPVPQPTPTRHPRPVAELLGSRSQRIPVASTNRIPFRHERSSRRLRPGHRCRRCTTGSSGWIRCHNSSVTSSPSTAPPQRWVWQLDAPTSVQVHSD
jgi:hypothetical protein